MEIYLEVSEWQSPSLEITTFIIVLEFKVIGGYDMALIILSSVADNGSVGYHVGDHLFI